MSEAQEIGWQDPNFGCLCAIVIVLSLGITAAIKGCHASEPVLAGAPAAPACAHGGIVIGDGPAGIAGSGTARILSVPAWSGYQIDSLDVGLGFNDGELAQKALARWVNAHPDHRIVSVVPCCGSSGLKHLVVVSSAP